jgi:hypothetical protein
MHSGFMYSCYYRTVNLAGIANRLRAGRPGDRIPVGAVFSSPVQTGPEVHPASYPMGTGYFPGVNCPGRGVDHPSPISADVKERVKLYLLSPWAYVACYRMKFTFTLHLQNSELLHEHFCHPTKF